MTYAAANNATAVVTFEDDVVEDGQVDLDPGANTITVAVTSSDGTVKTDLHGDGVPRPRHAQLTKLSLGDDVSL